MRIQWMMAHHMRQICDLHNDSHADTLTPRELSSAVRDYDMRAIVACERKRRVIAYAIYALGDDYVRIMDVVTTPRRRRRGVARAMLDYIASCHVSRARDRLVCQISERNVRAQLWLRSIGFRCTRSVPEGWDVGEDAYDFAQTFLVTSEQMPCGQRS